MEIDDVKKLGICMASCRAESMREWLRRWRGELDWLTKNLGLQVELHLMLDMEQTDATWGMVCDKAPREIITYRAGHDWVAGLPAALNIDNQSLVIDHPQKLIHHHTTPIITVGSGSITPKQTSASKSAAILSAYLSGCDVFVVFDDDCYPLEGVEAIEEHIRRLGELVSPWAMPTMSDMRARGEPYLPLAKVVLNHGCWVGNPDIDAITGLAMLGEELPETYFNDAPVPVGALFPMCGMNISFLREAAPLMYFGLHGPEWGVDRYDDIWCGFIAKKCLDACGLAVMTGKPLINHSQASDPLVNLVKEASGLQMNIDLYRHLMAMDVLPLMDLGLMVMARTIADSLCGLGEVTGNTYWQSYSKAFTKWLALFKVEEAEDGKNVEEHSQGPEREEAENESNT